MKTSLLLSNKYKIYGWILFVPCLVFGIYSIIFGYPSDLIHFTTFAIVRGGAFESTDFLTLTEEDMTFSIFGILFILGGLILSFSKVKNEDEFTNEIRLNSFQWAVLINFILLMISIVFVFGNHFTTIMLINMFATLIIFVIRFHYQIYKISKIDSNEK